MVSFVSPLLPPYPLLQGEGGVGTQGRPNIRCLLPGRRVGIVPHASLPYRLSVTPPSRALTDSLLHLPLMPLQTVLHLPMMPLQTVC